MHKQSWQWSQEIKVLFQKQSLPTWQLSEQKQNLLSFLKRQVQKTVTGMNLHLTPHNHSTLMWLGPQEDFEPTPVAAQSHPLVYVTIQTVLILLTPCRNQRYLTYNYMFQSDSMQLSITTPYPAANPQEFSRGKVLIFTIFQLYHYKT